MARASRRLALPCAALAAIIAAGVAAQTPPIYRYTDPSGRVIYTDHMPPANAKNVEAKRLTQNMIETDKLPLQAQRAQERYPVTLYTFACGDVCDKAEALLDDAGYPRAPASRRAQPTLAVPKGAATSAAAPGAAPAAPPPAVPAQTGGYPKL